MIKDGKAYFINPWFNREVQMPEFAGVEWGEAGRRPFINEEERDQIASALLRYANKKAVEEKAAYDEAMARQKKAAEEGELDRLAAIQRRTQTPAPPAPAPDLPSPRPTTPSEPQRPATAQRQVEVRAQGVGRGQPIRVVINSGPLNLSRITARVVR
jgi:hypothetical protein